MASRNLLVARLVAPNLANLLPSTTSGTAARNPLQMSLSSLQSLGSAKSSVSVPTALVIVSARDAKGSVLAELAVEFGAPGTMLAWLGEDETSQILSEPRPGAATTLLPSKLTAKALIAFTVTLRQATPCESQFLTSSSPTMIKEDPSAL